MLRDIYLYGDLADKFGSHHRYAAKSIPEAMWAIHANSDWKFFQAIKRDGRYQVVHGPSLESDESTFLGEKQLIMQFGPGTFHIAPVIEGSGGGGSGKAIGMVVLGVALMATGIGGAAYAAAQAGVGFGSGFGLTALGTAGSFLSISWGGIAAIGTVLALSGVSQMLTPTPEITSYDNIIESEKHRKSWIFNGPRNSIEQGGCIPVVFGRHWIGSTVVSAGIEVKDPKDD